MRNIKHLVPNAQKILMNLIIILRYLKQELWICNKHWMIKFQKKQKKLIHYKIRKKKNHYYFQE